MAPLMASGNLKRLIPRVIGIHGKRALWCAIEVCASFDSSYMAFTSLSSLLAPKTNIEESKNDASGRHHLANLYGKRYEDYHRRQRLNVRSPTKSPFQPGGRMLIPCSNGE
jgi:hypothetical protein